MGKYCYVEFPSDPSPTFSDVLQHSIPFPQCFHQTHPFQNSLTLHLLLRSASTTTKQIPLTSITEAIHPQNYHRAYMDIIGTLIEYHRHISESVQSQNHSESLTGEVPSQSCSIIKEVSVLHFLFMTLLLLHSYPSLVVLKGQVLCSYSPVCNQIRFPSEYHSSALLLISLSPKPSSKLGHQVPRQGNST